jgi:pyruvate dehydrogenase E1 component
MVHRAQRPGVGVGGHISTYASSATLYEVGFNHFFRGKDHPGGGDQVFFQGHASPGIYARAFLEGRLSEDRTWTASARSSATSSTGIRRCPATRTRG